MNYREIAGNTGVANIKWFKGGKKGEILGANLSKYLSVEYSPLGANMLYRNGSQPIMYSLLGQEADSVLYNVPCTYFIYIFTHGTYYIVLTVRSVYLLFGSY